MLANVIKVGQNMDMASIRGKGDGGIVLMQQSTCCNELTNGAHVDKEKKQKLVVVHSSIKTKKLCMSLSTMVSLVLVLVALLARVTAYW